MSKVKKDPQPEILREVPVAKVEKKEDSQYPYLFGLVPFPVPSFIFTLIGWAIRFYVLYRICLEAYDIRLFAIKEYGLVIHEFDPWFNYRATEYLERNGWEKFFSWFDYMSWYPLGRPVGTTIYPGMQISSVLIYRILDFLGKPYAMSLNDVCVYVPAWFGVSATLFLGLLTAEVSGSWNAGVIGAGIMAIIPAHIMRSVGGGYDNESVAMTAMCATFYFWVLSIRTEKHWPFGILTGLAYIYMAAAWGGFIFVLNLIGLHAALLLASNIARGYHSSALYRAYSLWFIIGTFGATRVPVINFTPFKSLEQLAPFLLFLAFQLFEFCHYLSRKRNYEPNSADEWRLKFHVFGIASVVGFGVVAMLYPTGFFGPLSSRVRGLFLKHTRTGNPLVDSVAEHQPANEQAFNSYLMGTFRFIPMGVAFLFLNFKRYTSTSFLIVYTSVAFFFATKMSRLLLLLAPVASSTVGVFFGYLVDFALDQIIVRLGSPASEDEEKSTKSKQKVKSFSIKREINRIIALYNSPAGYMLRLVVVAAIIFFIWSLIPQAQTFHKDCRDRARGHSSPQIMFKTQDGRIIDDYREAYWWLRDRTPKSARVLSWWDYGYQITGIGNRTTLADGNTWNHEQIATIGYMLTSPVKKAHTLVRHLADYVLVWGGGHGDDLAKSPHMARIGNSVYHDICPNDPTCSQFGFYSMPDRPTPMMANSLLFNLIQNGIHKDAYVDPTLFTMAYQSKNRLVRIFKVENVSRESKLWLADPANRKCDAPGSWYCVGQYPPAQPIQDLIARRTDFAQLEDFNRKAATEKTKQYQKEYMQNMEHGYKGKPAAKQQTQPKKQAKKETAKPSPKGTWKNTDGTTRMWQLIHNGEIEEISDWLRDYPDTVEMRSADGRGPLWWAYEEGDEQIINLLISKGAPVNEKDAKGMKPSDLKR